ncbi:PrgI family protein [Patescibacteria group bacterium]|nr:PrgI family protein [Patescibacteria group bacterium]
MPIEAVKVPQNVQVEDRLIGPITIRQVMICLAGGSISFVGWNMMKSVGMVTPVHFIFAWIPLMIAAAFAFVRYKNLSLLRIILLMIEKGQKPSKRFFGPRTGIAINIRTYFHTEQKKEKYSIDQTRVAPDKFEHLSSVLDKGSIEAKSEQTTEEESNIKQDDEIQDKKRNMPVDPNRVSVDPVQSTKPSVDGMGNSSEQSPYPIIKDKTPHSF